jgi:hypothetical protein
MKRCRPFVALASCFARASARTGGNAVSVLTTGCWPIIITQCSHLMPWRWRDCRRGRTGAITVWWIGVASMTTWSIRFNRRRTLWCFLLLRREPRPEEAACHLRMRERRCSVLGIRSGSDCRKLRLGRQANGIEAIPDYASGKSDCRLFPAEATTESGFRRCHKRSIPSPGESQIGSRARHPQHADLRTIGAG